MVPQMAVQALFVTVRDGIREPRIGFAAIAPSGDAVEVTPVDGVDRDQALARLRALSRAPGATAAAETERFTIADSAGGVLRLTPTPVAIADARARAVDQTIDVLDQRLNSLRLKPTFSRDGDDRIVIEVPALPDTASLKALIVAPGKLAFRLIDTSIGVDEAKRGPMPPQTEILQGRNGTPFLVKTRIAMSGENLVDAQPSLDQRTGEPMVNFRFNAAGTRQFARATEQSVGSPLAIVLDGLVLAAPIVREPIRGGSGQISGAFTLESANNLAILMRSGVLPAPLTVIDERTLGPSWP
jgi:preprotein translocase subunit SecD